MEAESVCLAAMTISQRRRYERDKQILELAATNKHTRDEIAQMTGYSVQHIHSLLKRAGIKTPRPDIRMERHFKMLHAINSGMTHSDISKQFGVSRQRVQQVAARAGIFPRDDINDRAAKAFEAIRAGAFVEDAAEQNALTIETLKSKCRKAGVSFVRRPTQITDTRKKWLLAIKLLLDGLGRGAIASKTGLTLQHITQLASDCRSVGFDIQTFYHERKPSSHDAMSVAL